MNQCLRCLLQWISPSIGLHLFSVCTFMHWWNSCCITGVRESPWLCFQLRLYTLTSRVCVSVCFFWRAIENMLRVRGELSVISLQPTVILALKPALHASSCFLFLFLLSFISLYSLKSNHFKTFQCSFPYVGMLSRAARRLSERYKRRPLMSFLAWFGHSSFSPCVWRFCQYFLIIQGWFSFFPSSPLACWIFIMNYPQLTHLDFTSFYSTEVPASLFFTL